MVKFEWSTKTTLQMVERNAARDVCFSNLVISHFHEAHLDIGRSWLAGHCFFSKDFFSEFWYRRLLYAMFVCIPISNSQVAPAWKRIQLLGPKSRQIEAPLERLANLWTCLTCSYPLGIGGSIMLSYQRNVHHPSSEVDWVLYAYVWTTFADLVIYYYP